MTSANDKRMYQRVGKKLIAVIWDEADGDWRKFVKHWRYGAGSDKDVAQTDSRYFKAFERVYEG